MPGQHFSAAAELTRYHASELDWMTAGALYAGG